jgi:hypothetical protein
MSWIDNAEVVNFDRDVFGAACICEAKDSPQGRIVQDLYDGSGRKG